MIRIVCMCREKQILVTKTQLEGTSPQVDNRGGVSPRKIWRQFREVNVFLVFAREASGGRGVEVAREASGVCEGKKKNRDKP